MYIPSRDDVTKCKNVLERAMNDLKSSDDINLIKSRDDRDTYERKDDKRIPSRILHEICINHRFAVYLERHIHNEICNEYYVDLEYNRYSNIPKFVEKNGKKKLVRPDIIVHTRKKEIETITSNKEVIRSNYLVIEAKKEELSSVDEYKVIDFIKDIKYEYTFGLRIAYNRFCQIDADLFFRDENNNGKIGYQKIMCAD